MNLETNSASPASTPPDKPSGGAAEEPQTPALAVPASHVLTEGGGAYLKKTTAQPKRTRFWLYAALILVIAASGAGYWVLHRPAEIDIVRPALTSINETIASSGLVGGVKESSIGASFNGAVLRLPVKLGDHVQAGETLAVLKNDITQAQVTQAETAVVTARAQLKQTSRGPLASELQASLMQVSQARALAAQAISELDLARKTQQRTQALSKAGVVSRSDMDTSASALAAAEAKSRSGTASIRLAEAQLQTVRSTPRQEDVELARDRLAEAQQSLLVVREQAGEATVTAPFSGTITAVNVEVGQNVDALGLFGLVSDALEIRIDLDESNLADISLGQKALLSAAAFPGETFEGKLKEISPSINKIRGTVSIKLEPIAPPAWLKSGQTLNVNLVTNQAAWRLLVPASALRRSGDRNVALVVQGDRAIEKIVVTRPPTDKGIPVLAGLDASALVIVNPGKIQPGDTVRIKK
ncbi:MAG: efflux RND transporter periplasmic adaptor subunit [Acidobacteria bacterium]|nr:efflux RND transporter periplasmic adaptor subunit [Acidobacteriota bacterium]